MHVSILKKVETGPAEDRQSLKQRLLAVMFVMVVLATSLVLGGCAVQRQAVNPDDYVEIDNPFSDDSSPGSSQKIWVPRKSLEKGPPRGGELLKKGYESVAGRPSPEPGLVVEANKPPTAGHVRTRLLIAEVGEPAVGASLGTFLSRGCIVRPVARTSAGVPAGEAEQLTFLKMLAAQPAGGPLLILAKTEGTKPGARLKADLYDLRGPILIRSFSVTVPAAVKDQTPDEALLSALKGVADATLNSLGWFSWYGRVVTVSGERVYIDAGAESGLKPGQKLVVYRGGEAIKGIGFAPGEPISAFPITSLVGTDGAFGTTVDAPKVQPGDYVELEK